MKCNFICVKIKDNNNIINLNNGKIQEIFKLSIGNNIINFNYMKNQNESSNKNKEIIYYKKFVKKNIGKMIYKTNEYNKIIKIFNQEFISNNIKRSKIIINNKQYDLKENIIIENQILRIEIKFLDIIINLNSMFEDCKYLFSIHNFQNIITKYLKTIFNLFYGCSSLLYIDDISNWSINNINDISKLFCQCSSLESLPDISKWNMNNVNYINKLLYGCSNLQYLPDISIWNVNNIIDMNCLFYNCSSLNSIPDISKWNTSNLNFLFFIYPNDEYSLIRNKDLLYS